MAVSHGLLRVSMISCLLISSVTCLPAPKDHGSPGNPAPSDSVGLPSTSAPGFPTGGRLDSIASFSSSFGNLLPFLTAQNNKPDSVGLGDKFSGPQATGSINNAGVSEKGYAPAGDYRSLASTGYGDITYGNAGVGTGMGSDSFSGPQATGSIKNAGASKAAPFKEGYDAQTGGYGSLALSGNDVWYGNSGYGNADFGSGLGTVGSVGSFSAPQVTGSTNEGSVSNAGVSNAGGAKGGYYAPTGAHGGLAFTGYGSSGYGNAGGGTGLGSVGSVGSFSVPYATASTNKGGASNAGASKGGSYAPTGAHGSLAFTGYSSSGYGNAGGGTGLGSIGSVGSFSAPQVTGSTNNAGASKGGSYAPTGAHGSLAFTGYGSSGYGNAGGGTGLGSVSSVGSFSAPQVTGSTNNAGASNAGASKGGSYAPTGAHGSLAFTGYGSSGYGNAGSGYGNAGGGTGLGSVGSVGSFSAPQVTGSTNNAGASKGGSYAPTGAHGSLAFTSYGSSGYGNAGGGTGLGSVGSVGSFSAPQVTGSTNNAGASKGGSYAPTGAHGSLAFTGYGSSGYGNAGGGTGLGSVSSVGSFSAPQVTGSTNDAGASNAGASKGGSYAPTGAHGSLAFTGYGSSGYGNAGSGYGNAGGGTGLGSVGSVGSFSAPQVTGSTNNAGASKGGSYAPTGAHGSLAFTSYGSSGYGNAGGGTGLGSVGSVGSFSAPQVTGSTNNAGASKGGSYAPTGAHGSLAFTRYGSSGYGNAGSGYGNAGGGTGLGSVGSVGSFSAPQVTGSTNNAGASKGGSYAPTGAHGSLAFTGYGSSGYGNAGSGYGNAGSGYGNAGVGTGIYNAGSTDGIGGNSQFYSDTDVEESPEPVLTDLSHLEPVYGYTSHSSYQRGRKQFFQTRYTPGDAQMPTAMSSPQQLVQTPAKGDF